MGRGHIEREIGGLWLISAESERRRKKKINKKEVFSMHKKDVFVV